MHFCIDILRLRNRFFFYDTKLLFIRCHVSLRQRKFCFFVKLILYVIIFPLILSIIQKELAIPFFLKGYVMFTNFISQYQQKSQNNSIFDVLCKESFCNYFFFDNFDYSKKSWPSQRSAAVFKKAFSIHILASRYTLLMNHNKIYFLLW